ncbi:MAG: ABC transporter permease [Gemmatimonadetes bacterium]|nr:ABC transporter permease [Gemmatimonadota bacterium]
MTRRFSRWLVASAALVYLFLHAPVLALMVFSFNDSKFSASWMGFTLEWYRRLVERDDILLGLGRSLAIGLGATVVATGLGTLLALAFHRHRFPGKRAAESLLYLAIVTPEIIMGISLLAAFVAVGFSLGTLTVAIAHVTFSISFVAVVVGARLRGMDRNLEEAAMMLGADEWEAFWKVTVPSLMPGIVAGALLAFTMSFDDYVITSFVAGPGSSTLPLVVYGMVRRNIEPSINAISTLIVVITSLLIYLADRSMRRSAR